MPNKCYQRICIELLNHPPYKCSVSIQARWYRRAQTPILLSSNETQSIESNTTINHAITHSLRAAVVFSFGQSTNVWTYSSASLTSHEKCMNEFKLNLINCVFVYGNLSTVERWCNSAFDSRWLLVACWCDKNAAHLIPRITIFTHSAHSIVPFHQQFIAFYSFVVPIFGRAAASMRLIQLKWMARYDRAEHEVKWNRCVRDYSISMFLHFNVSLQDTYSNTIKSFKFLTKSDFWVLGARSRVNSECVIEMFRRWVGWGQFDHIKRNKFDWCALALNINILLNYYFDTVLFSVCQHLIARAIDAFEKKRR